MTNQKSRDTYNVAKKWIILGIPTLWVFGCLMHFVYDWTGKLTVIGIFAPVNESIWEHLKLVIYPTLIWWLGVYLVIRKNNSIEFSRWFVCSTVSEIVAPIVIMSFFYTYTGAFGIESLVLDIFSLILGVFIAQYLALHIYKNAKLNRYCFYGSVVIIILIIISFTVFTFAPPKLPLFVDSVTGMYGIH